VARFEILCCSSSVFELFCVVHCKLLLHLAGPFWPFYKRKWPYARFTFFSRPLLLMLGTVEGAFFMLGSDDGSELGALGAELGSALGASKI